MRLDMVQSYVRDLLEKMTGTRPEPDHDGDFPVTYGHAQFFVRVTHPADPVVQVFSVAVAELERSGELMTAVNDINLNIKFARAMFVGSQLLIEFEIWGADVNPDNFAYACRTVAGATDTYAPRIVEKFGGVARFEESKEPGYEQEELFEEPAPGMYL
jgi:hypothetical protein